MLLVGVRQVAMGLVTLIVVAYIAHLGIALAKGLAPRPALWHSLEKTGAYLARLARGDLGRSEAGSITLLTKPVSDVLPGVLTKSLLLLVVSLSLSTTIGIGLGLWAAERRNTRWSLPLLFISIVGISLPTFFVGLLLQLAMIRWASVFGRSLLPVGGFGWGKHMILPALVLASRPIAQIARVTQVCVGEILDRDYVRTAHSKGLRARAIRYRHVMRNAAVPIATTVGLSLRFSLSSLPVVEFFFGWPGIGYTLLKGISHHDTNLTVALVLCLGMMFIATNLLLDLAYRLLDPRVRRPPTALLAGTRDGIVASIRALVTDLGEWIAYRWPWRPRREMPLDASGETSPQVATPPDELPVPEPAKSRAGRHNPVASPFLWLGGALVVFLVVVFVFGPQLAPHSPYTTRAMMRVDGELVAPPLAPSETHPWGTDAIGRDMLSLVLAGAQQTLSLAAVAVLARVVLGTILGIMAGWAHGSWLDRALLRAAEIIAAFPTLLLVMMGVLALGIRRGIMPFVVALCFVGWGEIMQYVRAQVLALRSRLFVESAIAVGLRTPRLLVGHILPNLLSALISITALEMGAVLMLLGELGFVGIFVGGGAFRELMWLAPVYHYSDVPEWGALLSNVRTYARSYPWMAIYPASAFFVAIVGFNLFGEGIRRVVETAHGRFLQRLGRLVPAALMVLVALGAVWARGNMGSVSVYRQQADAFDGQRAHNHVAALAQLAPDGRTLGSPGMGAAADYIAEQFESLGLQPAGEDDGYAQTRSRAYETLIAVPRFEIADGGPALTYRRDYVEYPGPDRVRGEIRGKARYLALGELTTIGEWGPYVPLADADYGQECLIVPSARDIAYLKRVRCGGILVVAPEGTSLETRHTLSALDPFHSWRTPMLWIDEATANRLLSGSGHTARELGLDAAELGRNEMLDIPLDVSVAVEVTSIHHEDVPAKHIIGHLPGRAASIEGAPIAETQKLDDRLIVLLAQYDTPPQYPGGESCPAANDNASGVAVMIEIVRAMREMGYQPYKTFLFVAYSGEGQEGGEWVSHPPEIAKLLQAKTGFSSSFEIEAIVDLRGLGAGEGDGLIVSADGSVRLTRLLQRSGRIMGIPVRQQKELVDISIVFEDRDYELGGQEAPGLRVSWDGWDETSYTPNDTLESISGEKLESAGRALALTLMTMGCEINY